MKKIISIIVCMLVCLSSILIMPEKMKVKASGGSGGGDEGIGLDKDFVWSVTENLSRIVHSAYDPGDIRKGRAFGTKGDWYAQNLTADYMGDFNLSGVTLLPINYINRIGCRYKTYSNKVVTNDFQIIIYNHSTEEYPYQQSIPLSEIFVAPAGWRHKAGLGGSVTHNYTYDNVSIRALYDSSENRSVPWPFGGTYNGYYFNLTYQKRNDNELMIGNVTYISSEENISEEQEGKIFLMEEEQSCEEKIDNISNNAGGCILLYNSSKDYAYENASNYNFSVMRANYSDDEENITTIKNMLDNGEIMIVDNMVTEDILTFTYNLTEQHCLPNEDYFFLHKIRNCTKLPLGTGTIRQYIDWSFAVTVGIKMWINNHLPLPSDCKGFILWDHLDTHFMAPTNRGWIFFWKAHFPALPIFTINNSVGSWLYNHTENTKISGYLD